MKIVLIILGIMMLLIGSCSYMLYSGFKDWPDYATEESLSKKYHSLITDVDELILNSTGAYNLAASLEELNYPNNIAVVNLEKENDADDIVVKNKFLNDPSSTFISNGFGYGTIDSQNIVIISRPVNKYGIVNLELFLIHNEGN